MLTQGSQNLGVSSFFQIIHMSQQVAIVSLCPKLWIALLWIWILPPWVGNKMSYRKGTEEKGRRTLGGQSWNESELILPQRKQRNVLLFPGNFNVQFLRGQLRLIDLSQFSIGQLLQHIFLQYLVKSGVQETSRQCKDRKNPVIKSTSLVLSNLGFKKTIK